MTLSEFFEGDRKATVSSGVNGFVVEFFKNGSLSRRQIFENKETADIFAQDFVEKSTVDESVTGGSHLLQE